VIWVTNTAYLDWVEIMYFLADGQNNSGVSSSFLPGKKNTGGTFAKKIFVVFLPRF
jgi:hypothetical protein